MTQPVWNGQALVLSTYHPARILRGGSALDMPARQHLRHAADASQALHQGVLPPLVDVGQAPPGAEVAHTLADLARWEEGPLHEGIVVDVEDVGVCIGVGLCRIADEVALWVPFRGAAGTLVWPPDQLPHVVDWLDRLMAKWPIVMHNGQSADVPWLTRLGLRVDGYLEGADTLLMAHLLWAEQPKGLQFLATLLLRYPNWKHLMKGGDDEMVNEIK